VRELSRPGQLKERQRDRMTTRVEMRSEPPSLYSISSLLVENALLLFDEHVLWHYIRYPYNNRRSSVAASNASA